MITIAPPALCAGELIKRALAQVYSKCSPGPDGISIDVLKHASSAIIPNLYKLFNEIFSSGLVPDEWGKSVIAPIHKKG